MENNIGISFPFMVSPDGEYFSMNKTVLNEIKSNLVHLILTPKGERYMKPSFGTNLYSYIFEQNDDITKNEIIKEIQDVIKNNIPNLTINSISINSSEDDDYKVDVIIDYKYTSDTVFQQNDLLTIRL